MKTKKEKYTQHKTKEKTMKQIIIIITKNIFEIKTKEQTKIKIKM